MEFRELIEESMTSAFDALVQMPHTAPTPTGDWVTNAAMIGFAGDHLRGMLGVAVNSTTLADVALRLGAPEIDGGPEDALGELANLLLGHATRAWARHEIDVMIGTPLVVAGSAIEVRSPRAARQLQVSSHNGARRCVAWLDAHVSPELESGDLIPPSDTVKVGDILLF